MYTLAICFFIGLPFELVTLKPFNFCVRYGARSLRKNSTSLSRSMCHRTINSSIHYKISVLARDTAA